MKIWNVGKRVASGLAAVFLTVAAGELSSNAPVSWFGSDRAIAQTTADLCRRVSERRGLVVRSRPTPNSPVVGGVPYAQEVTLVRNYEGIRGPGGRSWIEITYPMRGFVSNGYPGGSGNLADCSEDVTEDDRPPARNLCRQIDRRAAPRGVVVRADPSRFSARRGGVPSGDQVQLAADYRLIRDPNGENRDWVRITSPVAGYISANTLIMCRY
ncbi:SH3 domain-containing protein [Lyngbya sp. CCY1209]|uniref:SH3 domain-containing protein n=1 Tax=Lyngbya sp. CCY1209 TaxID=2886103 RepID=UPI002D20CA8C|nr:SH3 domain-containing protein [Lyngbya sp. CCY1209]MEB3886099.1 SH3 domain-containing protein [Lyngbya sp. CCY1209]